MTSVQSPATATAALVRVRVEAEESVGRSYSATAKAGGSTVPGLGAIRSALRTRTFDPFTGGAVPVVNSTSMAWVNLRCATREQILEYFQNTWDLTTTLFSVSLSAYDAGDCGADWGSLLVQSQQLHIMCGWHAAQLVPCRRYGTTASST